MQISSEAATTGLGIGFLLVGVIYRDILRRVGFVEKQYQEIVPQLSEISADVKFIRMNCPRCQGDL